MTKLKLLLSTLCFTAIAFSSNADNVIKVNVVNVDKKPLENMVVYIEPVDHEVALKNATTLEVGQQNQAFIPYISVMQLGSDVQFNNQDSITHHIYSPVGDNKFSVKVRSGEQIVKSDFDTAGAVSMGCNIHDWMSGYMLIVDTPYFTKSDKNGASEIIIDSPGKYKIIVWHPQMDAPDNRTTKVVNINSAMEVRMQLSKPMFDIPSQESEDDFDFLSDY